MNIKTINLTGSEVAVKVGGGNSEIKNNGTDTIYASAASGIVAGADGVVSIPAGSSVTVRDTRGTVYILGTGSVEVVGKDDTVPVFKTAASSGGAGGTEDEVARNAINAHAGNAEIHVTSAEKQYWNAKADISDIPTSLPANGGNADTVDGKHASDFARSANPTISGVVSLTRSDTTTSNQIFAYQNTMRIRCSDPNAANKTYYDIIISPTGLAKEAYSNGTLISKGNLIDGGNAASVGVYTESAIAALEARIAALENGGTT